MKRSRVISWNDNGATGIGIRGGLWTATVGVKQFSVEDLIFSELLDVCTVDPVSIHFEFDLETGEAEGKLFSSDESGDESSKTSVSEKNLLVTGFIGSIQNTVPSQVFE